MDAVFHLSNGDRVSYLLNLMHSFGCSYICLWTYSPDINLLYCEEGHFQEDATTIQEVGSSGVTSLARKLFDEYKQSVFVVGIDFVPGLAFKNRNPYLELQDLDLQRLASVEVQRHFYLEARIKMVVFMGSERGEIELGMSYIPQNMEMRMRSLFPQDFGRAQACQATEVTRQAEQQSRHSSSSSQSMDSPEYPPLLYNFPSTSTYIHQQETIRPQSIPRPPGLSQLQNIPLPTPDDATLTRAYLAVLSSASSSTTSSMQPSPSGVQQGSTSHGGQVSQRPSAFKTYHSLGATSGSQMRSSLRRQTLFKRAVAYYRGINYRRMQEQASSQGSRPTSTQLHHMISERRRREKINESFLALRSLLPQGTKKDKASVLRTAKDYLSSLKSQLSDLSKRNQLLETQLKMKKEIAADVSTNERLIISVMPILESTSMERMVDLQVRLRGDNTASVTDVIIRLLEFLKQVREARLESMEAQTYQETLSEGSDQRSFTNLVTFRLRIEGNDWDESTFKEAVRRILADLGH